MIKAVRANGFGAAKYLISKKVDVNTQNGRALQELFTTVPQQDLWRYAAIIKLLLDSGANTNNLTVLQLALMRELGVST